MKILPAQGKLGFKFGQIYPMGFGMLSGKPHLGQDIICPTGTPVLAPETGTILRLASGNDLQGGNEIFMLGDSGMMHWFYHLSQFQCAKGEHVTAGQQIALSGNTGTATTAPHVHWGCGPQFSLDIKELIDPMVWVKEDDNMNWEQANGVLYAITGNMNHPDAQALADAANGNQEAETAIIQKAIAEKFILKGSTLDDTKQKIIEFITKL
jgi:murein DD-endopeptidase MepM/ murein hydrolase activator NlpD